MYNLFFLLILISGILGCSTPPSRAEKEARSRKLLDQMQEIEKKENLSPTEKKIDKHMVLGIRDYEKQVKLGKTQREASAELRKYLEDKIDDHDRIYLMVFIKQGRDSLSSNIKLFIEKSSGTVLRIESPFGRNLAIYCYIPIGSIRETAELEDVESICPGPTIKSGE
jgi:hypothetical protein